MNTIAALILVCTVTGALARHGLGGAWRRWEAVTVFVGCLIPAIGIYGYDGSWQAIAIGASIVAMAYADLLCKQFFGNLWLSLARYGSPVVLVTALTGVWLVLAAIPVQFFATWWAKRKGFPAGYDPHEQWEYMIGACMGFVYAAGPLLRQY